MERKKEKIILKNKSNMERKKTMVKIIERRALELWWINKIFRNYDFYVKYLSHDKIFYFFKLEAFLILINYI